jgi:hypothetical protein
LQEDGLLHRADSPGGSAAQKLRRMAGHAPVIAVGICVLFSLAHIVNLQTSNEGGWYWYARSLAVGQRLYSDMHLPLQPLFIEETAAFLMVFGKSWFASKIAPFLHAILFCAGFHFVLKRSHAISGVEKAVLICCGFFVSIGFVGYRFDDYHVVTDCTGLYAIVALLKLSEAETEQSRLAAAAIAGMLSGLSIVTRLNDGAALFVAVIVSIIVLAAGKRRTCSMIAIVGAATAVVLVVWTTGDSFRGWAISSIFRAAATKGGTSSVLAHPLQLPASAIETLEHWQNLQFVFYLVVSALICGLIIAPKFRHRAAVQASRVLGIALILFPLHRYWYRGNFEDQKLIIDVAAVGVFLIFGLTAFAVISSGIKLSRARLHYAANNREILILIPCGQLASGAMSSGGSHIGLYGPLAITIVLLPIVFPAAFRHLVLRGFTVAIAAMLALHIATFKWHTPYLWYTYRAEQLFSHRQWYKHPDYGWMYIDVNLLHMIEPICSTVDADASGELLSLPYPYPNYFCSIQPWHGYVQTFFDTSSAATIFQLIAELKNAPPKWIVYQRQLQVLSAHEETYNHRRPLPHRYLDTLIQDKLASGEWRAVYTSSFGSYPGLSDEWILIRTRN